MASALVEWERRACHYGGELTQKTVACRANLLSDERRHVESLNLYRSFVYCADSSCVDVGSYLRLTLSSPSD